MIFWKKYGLRKLLPRWPFWLVVFILVAMDIFLLERKYNIFSGGFLQTHRISGFIERSIFIVTLVSLESALAGFFWYLFNLVGIKRQIPSRHSDHLFLLIYGGGSVALIIAKYQILAYFGDFLSLAVLRNLGGGSLRDGLMYGLNEGSNFIFWCVVASLISWAVLKLLNRRSHVGTSEKNSGTTWIPGAGMVASLLLLISFAHIASSSPAMNKHLAKTTPYALASAATRPFMSSVSSPLELLLKDAESVAGRSPDVTNKLAFSGKRDNLILIVSESTRADVMDEAVQGRFVTPVWRALAAEGVAGRKYYSHTGYTTSSLKAIFRGSLDNTLPFGGTIFEILKKQGYQIVVLSGQDESFGEIAKESGAENVSDIFFDARSAKNDRVFSSTAQGSLTLSNVRLLEQFDAITAKLDWRRPIFLYVNFQAAHFPYYHQKMPLTITSSALPREKISEDYREKLKLTYLNAVSYSDWATGEIVARLKKLGVYERSLIAVSGDHGESLFEDGYLGHGFKIGDRQMHTLLVANRSIVPLSGLIGQKDLAKNLLLGIGASFERELDFKQEPVIQIVGALTAPSQLGYVYKNGERLTIDLSDGTVTATWLQAPVMVPKLIPKSRESEETLRLVAEWRNSFKRQLN